MRLFLTLLLVGVLQLIPFSKSIGEEPSRSQEEITPITSVDYVSSKRFTKIHLEIICVDGAKPTSSSISVLSSKIIQYCDKPEGVTSSINTVSIITSQDWTWGCAFLMGSWRNFEATRFMFEYSKFETKDKTLVIHIAYLNGFYTGSPQIIGATLGPTFFVVFKNQITTINQESGVLIHEFGHLLGLVGLSTHSANEDKKHPPHCANENCIMNFQVGPNPILDFDEDCQKLIFSR